MKMNRRWFVLCAWYFATVCGMATVYAQSGVSEPPPAMSQSGSEKTEQDSKTEQAPDQRRSVKPGINDVFLDPKLDVQEFVARFEGESREIFASRNEILRAMNVRPGMIVADVGAGTGFFSQLFRQAVGDRGHVFAVDISVRFLEHIRDRVAEAGLDNVTPVLCASDNVNLPAHSIDLAFICDTYHHFEYPADTMRSIHRALRDGGRVALIDFERIPGRSRDWVVNHVRAGKETFRNEILSAGFELEREVAISGFSENYFLLFRKKVSPSDADEGATPEGNEMP